MLSGINSAVTESQGKYNVTLKLSVYLSLHCHAFFTRTNAEHTYEMTGDNALFRTQQAAWSALGATFACSS